MTTRSPQTSKRTVRLGGALIGLAVALGGCQHDEAAIASIPDDYKQRHPIAIAEANQSTVVFVGHARGGLTASQRADVMGVASTWLHEGTGAIHVDVPTDTPNARAAAESLREIEAMLTAAGVPPRGVIVHRYRPQDSRFLPPIRLTYSNFGCATQRNLAAMIDNPSDLEQPRPETPAYQMRRNTAFEKYRKGTTTTTTYPEADKAKISETGK